MVWITTCWKYNLMHLAMEEKFGTCTTLDDGEFNEDRGSSNRRRRWWWCQRMIGRAVYAKNDDLKLTKAGGSKIRRTTTPPIFSSGMLDILLIEWCYQGRKLFGSSTRSTGASSIPTPWVKQEQWRRHIIEAVIFAGESMVMTLKPRMHNKTLRRPQDQDHRHLRIDS